MKSINDRIEVLEPLVKMVLRKFGARKYTRLVDQDEARSIALVTLWKSLERAKDGEPPPKRLLYARMATAIKRKWIDELRRSRVVRMESLEGSERASLRSWKHSNPDAEALREIRREASDRDKRILELLEEGLSQREVCREVGLSRQEMRDFLADLRQKIRD